MGEEFHEKKTTDENGKQLKTQKQALKAREAAIANAHIEMKRTKKISRRTVKEVLRNTAKRAEMTENIRTIRKQDSLWENHLCEKFGKRFIDDISVAEVNDYLAGLYYTDNYSYQYTESFLKMFYLIFGQAYSRNYLVVDEYNKLCVNKDTRIKMPKLKSEDDTDIVAFSREELKKWIDILREQMQKLLIF